MTYLKKSVGIKSIKECHKADYHIYPKLCSPCTPSCQIAYPLFCFANTALPSTQSLVGNSAYHNNDIHLATGKQFPNNIYLLLLAILKISNKT